MIGLEPWEIVKEVGTLLWHNPVMCLLPCSFFGLVGAIVAGVIRHLKGVR